MRSPDRFSQERSSASVGLTLPAAEFIFDKTLLPPLRNSFEKRSGSLGFYKKLRYYCPMIGYLSGKVQAVFGKAILVDVNGVGYRVTIPEKNISSVSEIGSKVNLFTHFVMNPRDGSVELYGFANSEELHFFGLLTSVSGIGPKSAQAILSAVDLQQLQIGIIKEDPSYLTKVSGIGSKTAQRLILELKSKVMVTGLAESAERNDLTADGEAMDALIALGYSQSQARDAIKGVPASAATAEDKIKEALRILGLGPRRSSDSEARKK